jgi:hypothetical protein
MNLIFHSKLAVNQLSRERHNSSSHGAAVWQVSLAVLVATNSLLLFFLYIYDVI